jgi:MFS transporter, DHA2 family, multidrug resistance protein
MTSEAPLEHRERPMLFQDPLVHARRWRILLVLCLSLAVVMIANGSLNIALPALAQDLDASPSALQWMVDGYALVFAGLLFTAGTLGDRFGRKGALQAGLVLFLLAAVLAATATTSAQLIACRAVMGVAAAFVMPSTLSILTSIFPPEERGRAIGLWAGIAAGGAALGPVTTGFLLEHFSWGSVFLVNVPLIVLALVAGARLVPVNPDRGREPVDLPGAALSILGVGTLVYAIIEAPHHGWGSGRTLATFAVAAAVLLAFATRERSARHPMLDLQLFRDRRFSVASAGISMAFFAMFGTFFLVTQYLQLVLGYRPVAAGLTMLPISLTMMVLAPRAPRLVTRFGAARVVGTGLTLTAAGLVAFSTLGRSSPIAFVYAAYLPMMIGMSVSMSPLTTLIMSSVPHHRAGIGSAMNDTTRELGGALGVAVLGSLLTTRFGSAIAPALGGLPADDAGVAASGLAGALDVAAGLPGAAGGALADAARSAYVDGMGVAALVAAAVVGLTAVVAARLLPGRAELPVTAADPAGQPEPAGVLATATD